MSNRLDSFLCSSLDNIYTLMNESTDNTPLEFHSMFKLWLNTRNKAKQKLDSYNLFLELYNLFPETCIELVKSHLLIDIGYWKDIYLIWELINNLNMSIETKYAKYNKLIEAFTHTILNQRTEDLRKLNDTINPYRLNNITNDKLRQIINDKPIELSYIGKYLIREKSSFNKKAHWYIKNNDTFLEQNHISYILRNTIKIKNNNGEICDYPQDKPIPLTVKKNYRELNAKLNIALNVPEVLMCSNKFNLIDPSKLPYKFRINNEKALLNVKLHTPPKNTTELYNGNRRQNDIDRVLLRHRMLKYIENESESESETSDTNTYNSYTNNINNKYKLSYDIYNKLDEIINNSDEKYKI